MPDERNHTDEILDRIRTGSTLADSRDRRITLPDPVPAVSPRSTPLSRPSSYKKGWRGEKDELRELHKGELVLTKKKAEALK
jgi:hypothetical protein